MPPTRFETIREAGSYDSLRRWPFALAVLCGIATASPACAQQSLGSFPNSRGGGSGDVLPFAEGSGGNLQAPDSASRDANSSAPDDGFTWSDQPSTNAPTLEQTPELAAPQDNLSGTTKTNKVAPEAPPSPPAKWTWEPNPGDTGGAAPPAAGNLEQAAEQPPVVDSDWPATDGNVVFAAVESTETSPETTNPATTSNANTETPTNEATKDSSPSKTSETGGNTATESGWNLQNALSGERIISWLKGHGPSLLAILAGMIALWFLAGLCSRRIVAVIARGGDQGPREERIARSKTLVGVFHNASSMFIIVAGVLMVGQELNIAVAPLLGGAAAVGLAAAFGAQNLIRDYFNGFMILLENQYRLNDIIEIDGASGQVERITMRITVLRDLHGNVHFVPNGTIGTVTNMSHGWARSVLEIRIAYKEDTDRVMGILMELAGELRQDPDFAPMILDDAEMLGVDNLADSSVNLKFVIKTRPLKQWAVRRELLRRIKRRFDELNIEIPYPHRTILQQSAAPVHGPNGTPPEHADSLAYR